MRSPEVGSFIGTEGVAIAVGCRGRNDPGDGLESFKFGSESFMF